MLRSHDEPKGGTFSGGTNQTEADVRRQKEDAAKSLEDTVRASDERKRTKAIEGGKGVFIQ